MNRHSSFGDPGPSGYTHDDSISPSIQTGNLPPQYDHMVSPEMGTHMPLISPGPLGHHQHGHMLAPAPVPDFQQYQMPMHPGPPSRPPSQQHRPSFSGVNYMSMQRHSSIQTTTRSDSPHMLGGDVFGGSAIGSSSEASLMLDGNHLPVAYEYHTTPFSADLPQGISPARALGPAPTQLQPFTTPNSNDTHTTPTNAAYKVVLPSSSSIDSSSDNSSSIERPSTRHNKIELSDDENDSPTKRVGPRVPTLEPAQGDSRAMVPAKRTTALTARHQRPLPKAGPATGGGRTSAKFTKVAEDPGVEGIPPGARSMERPQQSFACIIGQAILKSSAGGLSLEHIYRYVETAYPYFKTVDQWRNSVRHNLSIHKIFVTIPRTDKYPPGKGGIWIIDENEKCHWPSEDKFIKNFPPIHPHHAYCRQTLHERAVDQRLREKAESEGRVYVPRKGKGKNRKAAALKDEAAPLPPPVHAAPGLPHPGPPPHCLQGPVPAIPLPPMMQQPQPHHMAPPPLPSSPPPIPNSQTTSSFDFEDDGDFVPEPCHAPQYPDASKNRNTMSLGPPIGHPDSSRNLRDEDEENVFGGGDNVFGSVPKRVRLAQPEPLSPIMEQQASSSGFLHDDPDMFITPSRERTRPSMASSSQHFTSSALKTPALIQTSSSPTSSPMPPTITRGSHHHPSGLQQAWTQDDMMRATTPTSPKAKLDPAFDLKPTPQKRDRDDDSFQSLVTHTERGAIPKTPVTRSSAAAERTPRIGGLRTPGMMTKTPLTYGSPARMPPSANALLSTPLWEMSGVLERLKNAESPTRTPRSDVPPTSPTHYSLSDCGDSPVAKRRKLAV